MRFGKPPTSCKFHILRDRKPSYSCTKSEKKKRLIQHRIASYNEVTNAYPSEKELTRIAGRKLDEEEWAEEFDAELGDLFKTEFFRVVLDEGHAIRNYHTKSLFAYYFSRGLGSLS